MVAVALACVGCEDPDARSADGGSDGEADATSSPTPGPCIRPRYLDDEFDPVPRRLPRLDPSTIERGEDASITGVLSLREDRSTERNYWLGDDEPGVEVVDDRVVVIDDRAPTSSCPGTCSSLAAARCTSSRSGSTATIRRTHRS